MRVNTKLTNWEYLLDYFEEYDVNRPKVSKELMDVRNTNNAAKLSQRRGVYYIL